MIVQTVFTLEKVDSQHCHNYEFFKTSQDLMYFLINLYISMI